ncbi:unnamed protein product [Vitrella brassicaformis CCMP3155]|uniref:RBR-type E3 ubiquitin transferase n=2 Tax=Vitrella brassicaformis TaxID=1169539 RepID=A0A0G4EAS4_VITBC|nr:unnamed protein product [Vitrella brassicaformis CCMP3155]|eukprot:CEL92756.1 unnamed protein product [Vitrella brassicaformis CCMP3155]
MAKRQTVWVPKSKTALPQDSHKDKKTDEPIPVTDEPPPSDELQNEEREDIVLDEGEREANERAQEDEIMALESIYMEAFKAISTDKSPRVFQLDVEVTFPDAPSSADAPSDEAIDVIARFEEPSAQHHPNYAGDEDHPDRLRIEQQDVPIGRVRFLPPLSLHIVMPPAYPSRRSPFFTLSAMWIDKGAVGRLCRRLDQLWEEEGPGSPIVFTWANFLSTDSMGYLSMGRLIVIAPLREEGGDGHTTGDPRAMQECADVGVCVEELLRYDASREDVEYRSTKHTCMICFDVMLGERMDRLPGCRHAYCTQCLAGLVKTHVKDGAINLLRCPEPSCGRSIDPEVLHRLLDEDEYERWQRLSLQKALDGMGDLVYCPRCEAHRNENTAVLEDADHLARCPKCHFAFCGICRAEWHPGTACLDPEQLLEVLEARSKGDKAYGEEVLRREQNLKQEAESLKTIKREARQCPTCGMAIYKTEGCNKMKCEQCYTNFCWKCLQPISGYEHFANNPNCNLFDMEEIERWNRMMRGLNHPRGPLGRPVVRRHPQFEDDDDDEDDDDEDWELMDDDDDEDDGDGDGDGDGRPEGRLRAPRRPRRGHRAAGMMLRIRQCPQCHSRNQKQGANNHIICWACRANFCYLCGARLQGKGAIGAHFGLGARCRQHTND